ncbi:hypothetical protein HDU88_003305 [Geranomyces variabilis]|nr:hypothetical protein HDU88_003305 [Geranomyces variabilis]
MLGHNLQENSDASSSDGPERLPAICRSGILTLLRGRTFGRQKSRSRIILCRPQTPDDFFEILAAMYPATTPATTRGLRPLPHVASTLGRLSQAAMRGAAVIIVVPECPNAEELDSRVAIIDMSAVRELKDERDLRETCTFALELEEGKDDAGGGLRGVRFKAEFSIDYLQWIAAIKEALAGTKRRSEDEALSRGRRAVFTPNPNPKTMNGDSDRRGRLAVPNQFERRTRAASVDAFSFSGSPGRRSLADVKVPPNPPSRPVPPIPSNAAQALRHKVPRSQSIDVLRAPALLFDDNNVHTTYNLRVSQSQRNDYFVLDEPVHADKDRSSATPAPTRAPPLRLPSVRRVSWHSGAEGSLRLSAGDNEPTRYDLAQDWGMPQLLVQNVVEPESEEVVMPVQASPLPRAEKKKQASGPPVAYRRAQGGQVSGNQQRDQQQREEPVRSSRYFGHDLQQQGPEYVSEPLREERPRSARQIGHDQQQQQELRERPYAREHQREEPGRFNRDFGHNQRQQGPKYVSEPHWQQPFSSPGHFEHDKQQQEMKNISYVTEQQSPMQGSFQQAYVQEQQFTVPCHSNNARPTGSAPIVSDARGCPELPHMVQHQLYSSPEPDLRRDSGVGSSMMGSSTTYSFVTSAPSDDLVLSETHHRLAERQQAPPVPLPRPRGHQLHHASLDLDRSAHDPFHQHRARHTGASLDITNYSRPTPPPRNRRVAPPARDAAGVGPQPRPVSLAGSPAGPPGQLREVPLISLTDPIGPRMWSQRRQKWVGLHTKVPTLPAGSR